MDETPTVYIVEDDERDLASLVDLVSSVRLPAVTFRTATEFLGRFTYSGPACLVLDQRLPEMGGLDLLDRLNRDNVDIPVVFLTGHGTVETAVRAMKAGAFDYLRKPCDDEMLIDAIRRALAEGERRFRAWQQDATLRERIDRLTPRENEVLDKLLDGLSGKEAARMLDVSPRTLENHRASILRKIGVRSTIQLFHLLARNADPN